MSSKNILLIEDNEGDIELTKIVLEECQTQNNLEVIKDGQEALDYLLKQTPDLVLLDIKLPNKNGFEIMQELQKHNRLDKLKIMMLTTGDSVESFEENYKVRANGYFVKPIPINDIENCLGKIN